MIKNKGKIFFNLPLIFLFCSIFFALADEFIKSSAIKNIEIRYGENARKRAVALNSLMSSIANASESEKLVRVNNFFNSFRWQDDLKVWNKKDYWATRMEFIGKGAGDCEDYVIAKYFTLKQLGIATNKLYFTYVKAIKHNQAHMVLSYYETPKSIPLVLDNINGNIKIATQRKDLIPVYSFNGDSLYLAKQEGLGQVVPGGNKKQNPKWIDLVDRIKKEGL
ncbi:transglutaminase-like cysteine peptidase [Campylobacter pinnipediorum]|uniref:transglutaminase-like cysteine peptidase n=1 Tax=Campylobacter pinnipediorum TaxID=1965231 RepID=UPI000994A36A|nr:transglutaminase-like cysteine peptidase [Campylobacter pinnipediorum]AQW81768.1 putative transglutaminase-like cysteine proteinase [Campylobacter pinnipediorum subsp. pinnipediorum]AQW83444.1 putative transglutaminase-like cysteine proteinase [Campylobacter pinnipediorum subsp. pinnipediorum]AQW84965.1 putative transglutaminase-like cysteine proteinase [Campylobacter pinnipediorum subsp. pinnipediorum]